MIKTIKFERIFSSLESFLEFLQQIHVKNMAVPTMKMALSSTYVYHYIEPNLKKKVFKILPPGG